MSIWVLTPSRARYHFLLYTVGNFHGCPALPTPQLSPNRLSLYRDLSLIVDIANSHAICWFVKLLDKTLFVRRNHTAVDIAFCSRHTTLINLDGLCYTSTHDSIVYKNIVHKIISRPQGTVIGAAASASMRWQQQHSKLSTQKGMLFQEQSLLYSLVVGF